jgi:hypothetical protein
VQDNGLPNIFSGKLQRIPLMTIEINLMQSQKEKKVEQLS